MSASTPALAERLTELANQVRRLSPDWTRPERFYERRSEIAGELRRVAAEADPGRLSVSGTGTVRHWKHL